MESEIKSFIKVWSVAIISLCYSYYVSARFPRGILRLFSILPIIYLFIILPFNLSSFHLCGPTVFYLVWLANFKLLLFSFNRGPLSPTPPLSLLHFISIALLPIKTKQSLTKYPDKTASNPKIFARLPHVVFMVKASIMVTIMCAYKYRDYLHQYIIMIFCCCYIYLSCEFTQYIVGLLVRKLLALDLEMQFNEPYLATSLQDFWGRRWNLMVRSVLRPTAYSPMRSILEVSLGPTWGPVPAILSTFCISGLVHEVVFSYLTRVRPTWEVMWFFLLHGVCTAAEVVVKKAVGGRWRLHRAFSGTLTISFVAVTCCWLFLPHILKNGVEQKAANEFAMVVNFVKDKIMDLLGLNF